MADGESLRSAEVGDLAWEEAREVEEPCRGLTGAISNSASLAVDHSAASLWREIHLRLIAACELIFNWIERSRQRRQLAALSDSSLRDLDISPADAEAEYRKYFWQQ